MRTKFVVVMVGAKPTALKAMLARGVTAVALTEWLEGSPKAALRALADVVVVVSAAAPAPPTPPTILQIT